MKGAQVQRASLRAIDCSQLHVVNHAAIVVEVHEVRHGGHHGGGERLGLLRRTGVIVMETHLFKSRTHAFVQLASDALKIASRTALEGASGGIWKGEFGREF